MNKKIKYKKINFSAAVLSYKIIPVIIASNFKELNINYIKKIIEKYKNILNETNEEQNSTFFRFSLYSIYLFILQIFKQLLYIPMYVCNTIPVNINELKEIYDIVYQSKYKNSTLDSLYRQIDSLQFQAFFLSYTFINLYLRK